MGGGVESGPLVRRLTEISLEKYSLSILHWIQDYSIIQESLSERQWVSRVQVREAEVEAYSFELSVIFFLKRPAPCCFWCVFCVFFSSKINYLNKPFRN